MWYAIEFFKEITLMNKELEYKTVNVDEVGYKFSDTLRNIYLRGILPQIFDNMVFYGCI